MKPVGLAYQVKAKSFSISRKILACCRISSMRKKMPTLFFPDLASFSRTLKDSFTTPRVGPRSSHRHQNRKKSCRLSPSYKYTLAYKYPFRVQDATSPKLFTPETQTGVPAVWHLPLPHHLHTTFSPPLQTPSEFSSPTFRRRARLSPPILQPSAPTDRVRPPAAPGRAGRRARSRYARSLGPRGCPRRVRGLPRSLAVPARASGT